MNKLEVINPHKNDTECNLGDYFQCKDTGSVYHVTRQYGGGLMILSNIQNGNWYGLPSENPLSGYEDYFDKLPVGTKIIIEITS